MATPRKLARPKSTMKKAAAAKKATAKATAKAKTKRAVTGLKRNMATRTALKKQERGKAKYGGSKVGANLGAGRRKQAMRKADITQ